MTYLQFLKLSYKRFLRSPNFSKNLLFKILSFVGYCFFAVYMLILVLMMFLYLKDKQPDVDLLIATNQFLFVYFFIVFYVMMYLNFDSMQVKPFMLLPVSKKKIVIFHLLDLITHPVNWIFLAMIAMYIGFMIHYGYQWPNLLAWGLAVLASIYIIEFILFLSSRNAVLNAIFGLLIFVIVYKMSFLKHYLSFIGDFYLDIYHKPFLSIIPMLILFIVVYGLSKYILKRFYLDDGIKKGNSEVKQLNLIWIEKYGLMGSLIKNDLRLIWRNIRPRQMLIGLLFFYVLTFFIIWQKYQSSEPIHFNILLFLLMLTGYFVMQFGNFIPSWDSEYYPLLMTQNMTYRDYLESKWWVLSLSVILLIVLGLPFIYFGWQMYALVVAMGIFNLGVSIPMTLYAGVYRTKPIKLNEKVKAFQSRDSFNARTFIFSLLRLFLPIGIFIFLDNYYGFMYGVIFLTLLGLIGVIFKNKLLDYLVRLYQKRKYITLNAFKNEAS